MSNIKKLDEKCCNFFGKNDLISPNCAFQDSMRENRSKIIFRQWLARNILLMKVKTMELKIKVQM